MQYFAETSKLSIYNVKYTWYNCKRSDLYFQLLEIEKHLKQKHD